MTRSPAAVLLSLLSCCALLSAVGCGESGVADSAAGNVPVGGEFKEQAIDVKKIVDSQDSWRVFVAESKQPERIKQAEEHFGESGPVNKVKIRFLKDEIEYMQFGPSNFKNVDPDRLYEVGVMRLEASENWGSDGFQLREYTLKFITPRRDGDWQFVMGWYQVPKSEGSWKADPQQQFAVEMKAWERGYLRDLFVKPLSELRKAAAARP